MSRSTHSGLSCAAAIVGIGATEYSKNSGRSEMQLATEAVTAALADAGLSATEVDGFATFTIDNNLEIEVARNIGAGDLRFFGRVGYGGGGACAPMLQAAMAVATGVAEVVVCYRAMNERSEYRFGSPSVFSAQIAGSDAALKSLHTVHGLRTPPAMIALLARRYMHEYGVTSEDFGRVAVAARRHAANNPAAWFYGKPITLADHQASRMIADPLRLLDCCQETDGAAAVVITSAERASHLPHRPALIRAAAQGASVGMLSLTNYYVPDICDALEVSLVARQLYEMAKVGPRDIQVAILYDHFTSSVLMQLEACGFCGRGEAPDYIKDGGIQIGGHLPVNTNGGQLGEGYVHGMNGIVEAVRQIRGSSINQITDVENVLVTASLSAPSSGMILSVSGAK
jgi:acetyl-CoA acetyltransferase